MKDYDLKTLQTRAEDVLRALGPRVPFDEMTAQALVSIGVGMLRAEGVPGAHVREIVDGVLRDVKRQNPGGHWFIFVFDGRIYEAETEEHLKILVRQLQEEGVPYRVEREP